ncbi:MAG: hypothetical protein HRU75_14020 [Planctomycetia bacterium]|nr:MAG: hypothetical protein HRU75_14020 [Planctomycetia bacterium]
MKFANFNRTFVLIIMSLLLVVFLIDRPMQELFDRWTAERIPVGEAFGRSLSTSDLAGPAADAAIARAFFGLNDRDFDDVTFYLAATEAHRAGVRVDLENVRTSIEQSPDALQIVSNLRNRFNRSIPGIYESLAGFLAAQQFQVMHQDSFLVSTPRLRHEFRQRTQEASVELSVIDAAALVSKVAEPTDEELQKAFEEGRNRDTAHADGKLVFGYLQPDRVRFEYLTVNPRDVQSHITVSLRDARSYYEKNRARYMKEVASPAVNPDGTPVTTRVQQTFEEVETQVRNDARTEKALEEALKMVATMQREALRPWEAAARDADGFRIPPPPEAQVSFEALRDKHGATIPITYKLEGPLDRSGISMLPGIGFAAHDRTDRAPSLLLRVKGLHKPAEGERQVILAVGEPAPVLTHSVPNPQTGQNTPAAAYLVRVIEVLPSGPPESLDAVRERVTKDVKLAKAYDLANQWKDRIVQRAGEAGLRTAVEEAAELRALLEPPPPAEEGAMVDRRAVEALGPFTPSMPFRRSPSAIPHIDFNAPLHQRVFEALEWDAATAPAHRIVVSPKVDHNQFSGTTAKIAIAEALEIKPLYEGDYDAQRESLRMRLSQFESSLFQDWFSPERLHARTGFKPAGR